MALISIIEDFHPLNNARLLDRAAQLTPPLRHSVRTPVRAACPGGDGKSPDLLLWPAMGRGDALCLDFGDHLVGYLMLELSGVGSHPDAPAFLKLRFAETKGELSQDAQSYDGWLSRSWIQEEIIHVDTLPARLRLDRRFAFRYLQITVLDTSPKYKLVVKRAECTTETSADPAAATPLDSGDPLLDRIHAVSLRTLADCMQEVFEDGPKRDRRLWMGDLRLQALTNYVSFRNTDLVKRCLYLFGGSRFPDGRISACVFAEPAPAADDTYLFDYALLYPVALEEYLRQTRDGEALDDLYDIAMEQIEYGLGQCGPDDIVGAGAVKDAFIDWCDEMDKTACAQAVLVYSLRYAIRLAERKGDTVRAERLRQRRDALRDAARRAFWSEKDGGFLSGGQLSAATQSWMTLADIPEPAQAVRAMRLAMDLTDNLRMNTPYMHHYYVMALLRAGLRAEAGAHLKSYWGGMLEAGADTFWECWDGANPDSSPYGGSIVNSYCHAWSCTPAYIIERFLLSDRVREEDE